MHLHSPTFLLSSIPKSLAEIMVGAATDQEGLFPILVWAATDQELFFPFLFRFQIKVTSTNSATLHFSKVFTIYINDTNEKPEKLQVSFDFSQRKQIMNHRKFCTLLTAHTL